MQRGRPAAFANVVGQRFEPRWDVRAEWALWANSKLAKPPVMEYTLPDCDTLEELDEYAARQFPGQAFSYAYMTHRLGLQLMKSVTVCFGDRVMSKRVSFNGEWVEDWTVDCSRDYVRLRCELCDYTDNQTDFWLQTWAENEEERRNRTGCAGLW